jgi:hypothetical protein
MTNQQPFQKEKLIISVLFNPQKTEAETIKGHLKEAFGKAAYESHLMPFPHTTYYEKEMGSPLERFFFSPGILVDPETLFDLKTRTNALEHDVFSEGGKRFVNLDPGLLSRAKLILASAKNYSHRIPLRNGIYAEVTLIYGHKEWHDLPWTYPDYKTPEIKKILNDLLK